MGFSEAAPSNGRAQEELARAHPLRSLLVDTGRNAGVMALVLTLEDLTPWPLYAGEPWARVGFIAFWSVLMALWTLWWLRKKDGMTNLPVPPAA